MRQPLAAGQGAPLEIATWRVQHGARDDELRLGWIFSWSPAHHTQQIVAARKATPEEPVQAAKEDR
jgi:hypothetical protein